jgi:hypothetical protein
VQVLLLLPDELVPAPEELWPEELLPAPEELVPAPDEPVPVPVEPDEPPPLLPPEQAARGTAKANVTNGRRDRSERPTNMARDLREDSGVFPSDREDGRGCELSQTFFRA